MSDRRLHLYPENAPSGTSLVAEPELSVERVPPKTAEEMPEHAPVSLSVIEKVRPAWLEDPRSWKSTLETYAAGAIKSAELSQAFEKVGPSTLLAPFQGTLGAGVTLGARRVISYLCGVPC